MGDYNRYLAEYGADERRSAAVISAEEAYKVILRPTSRHHAMSSALFQVGAN